MRHLQAGGLGDIVRTVQSIGVSHGRRLLFNHPTEPSPLEVFAHRMRGDTHGIPGEFVLLTMNALVAGHTVRMGHPALEALAPRPREAVRLLMTHGWSHKQIAAHMGLKPATIRRYLHLAYREFGVNSGPELLLLLRGDD